MSPYFVLIILSAYLILLFALAHRAARGSDNEGFFIGNRRTSWAQAALAMVGAAMSGVTFISVPFAQKIILNISIVILKKLEQMQS